MTAQATLVMPLHPTGRLTDSLESLARIGCFIFGSLSIIVIVGWFVDVDLFKSILPGVLPMNPLEALCFVAAAIALYLRIGKMQLSVLSYILINMLGTAIFFVGLLTIVNYISIGSFRIDALFFAPKLGKSLIAPNSAITFMLIGIALLSPKRDTQSSYVMTQLFTLLAGIIIMFAGIGYIYGIFSFYTFSVYSPMPFNTVSAFMLLSACLLFSTNGKGIMQILTDSFNVSKLSRRLIVTAIFLPLILGLLVSMFSTHLEAQQSIALLVIVEILTLTTLIWITTKELYKGAIAKRELSDSLAAKNTQLEEKSKQLTESLNQLHTANKKIKQLLENKYTLQDITDESE